MRLRRVEGGRGVPNEIADRCGAGDVTANGMRVDAGCAGGQGWRRRISDEPDGAEGALAECADEDKGREGCRGVGREGTSVGSGAESEAADSVVGTTASGRGVESGLRRARLGRSTGSSLIWYREGKRRWRRMGRTWVSGATGLWLGPGEGGRVLNKVADVLVGAVLVDGEGMGGTGS